jgi:hypothetical protein
LTRGKRHRQGKAKEAQEADWVGLGARPAGGLVVDLRLHQVRKVAVCTSVLI